MSFFFLFFPLSGSETFLRFPPLFSPLIRRRFPSSLKNQTDFSQRVGHHFLPFFFSSCCAKAPLSPPLFYFFPAFSFGDLPGRHRLALFDYHESYSNFPPLLPGVGMKYFFGPSRLAEHSFFPPSSIPFLFVSHGITLSSKTCSFATTTVSFSSRGGTRSPDLS